MLMDWVDFLVKMVNRNKFLTTQLDMKKLLISRSQEGLDCILDKLSFDKFIEMLKEGTKEMLDNKYLIERTIHHFRELQRMIKGNMDVYSDDWLLYNQRLGDSLLEGLKIRFKQQEDPEFVMFFKECRHFSSAVRRTREGETVLCQTCEDRDEHARVRHLFDRVRLNKEVLPSSDQFIPKVRGSYPRELDLCRLEQLSYYKLLRQGQKISERRPFILISVSAIQSGRF